MPSLDELKARWFIPMDGSSPDGIPVRRHTDESPLAVSTDGNNVSPLIDGQNYMHRWHTELESLHTSAVGECFHAAWRLEAVKTLGHTSSGNDALEDIDDADEAGVVLYPLLCRNLVSLPFNIVTVDWLRLHGVWTAVMDNRFPAGGSNHQKFAVFKDGTEARAVLGSIDISKTRWDTTSHLADDPDRNPAFGKPTHDTGVLVEGPAVADIELTFRERWNDSTRTLGLQPLLPSQPLITTPVTTPATGGSHSVQVLRTYGVTNTFFGYSWSPRGEFTVWASYLNAIKRATTLIYIEDQYFLPFDWPPCHTRGAGAARDTDLLYQLGEAIRRGARVGILVPSNAEDLWHGNQVYQRDIGLNYLNSVAMEPGAGSFLVTSLGTTTSGGSSGSGGSDGDEEEIVDVGIYVHSKLMIVDDEVVLIGSANVGQRSMTHDGELQIAVVDGDNQLAREFRKTLWAEHSERSAAIYDDPVSGFAEFVADVAASAGRLRPYPVDPLNIYPPTAASNAPPAGHDQKLRHVIDPYAGPAGVR
jgi:phosphatidylserine/phosphatidylglycerophosphate/cardiolipin synthase-like enzyme